MSAGLTRPGRDLARLLGSLACGGWSEQDTWIQTCSQDTWHLFAGANIATQAIPLQTERARMAPGARAFSWSKPQAERRRLTFGPEPACGQTGHDRVLVLHVEAPCPPPWQDGSIQGRPQGADARAHELDEGAPWPETPGSVRPVCLAPDRWSRYLAPLGQYRPAATSSWRRRVLT